MSILDNYAQYGIVPPFQVTPTTDVPIETERIPRQHETDLKFIQRLARAQRLCILHRAGNHGSQQSLLGAGESRWPSASRL